MTGRIVLVQAETTSYGALLIQAIYEDGTTNLPKGGGDIGKNVAGGWSLLSARHSLGCLFVWQHLAVSLF